MGCPKKRKLMNADSARTMPCGEGIKKQSCDPKSKDAKLGRLSELYQRSGKRANCKVDR